MLSIHGLKAHGLDEALLQILSKITPLLRRRLACCVKQVSELGFDPVEFWVDLLKIDLFFRRAPLEVGNHEYVYVPLHLDKVGSRELFLPRHSISTSIGE